MSKEPVKCAICGKDCVPTHGGLTTGYGTDSEGRKHCFACCGEKDKAEMIRTGKAVLYFSMEGNDPYKAKVSNWPGTLIFPCWGVKKGRHAFGHTQYSFRFKGPDGRVWSGLQIGDWNQIARCRRLKRQPTR